MMAEGEFVEDVVKAEELSFAYKLIYRLREGLWYLEKFVIEASLH